MASIKKQSTKKGEPRYDVRWRVNGCHAEKTFKMRAEAEIFRRKIESADVAGVSVDLRAGNRPFAQYAANWLSTKVDLNHERWRTSKAVSGTTQSPSSAT